VNLCLVEATWNSLVPPHCTGRTGRPLRQDHCWPGIQHRKRCHRAMSAWHQYIENELELVKLSAAYNRALTLPLKNTASATAKKRSRGNAPHASANFESQISPLANDLSWSISSAHKRAKSSQDAVTRALINSSGSGSPSAADKLGSAFGGLLR
jgi:hypothetical protein